MMHPDFLPTGMPTVVADPDSPAFKVAETLRSEWVVKVDGRVRLRPKGTENHDLPTGLIEVFDYYTSTSSGINATTAGGVAGQLQDVKIKQGESGTEIL